MKFKESDIKLLEDAGYEYVDARFCFAKRNFNVAVKQAEDRRLYINISKDVYKRGCQYDADGIFVGYFDTAYELLELLSVLSKYKIS